VLSAEAVREDLEHLYTTLQAGHPALFAHRPKAEYDALHAELLASVKRPLRRVEAAKLLQRFAAFGRFGHLHLDAPLQAFVEHLGRGGTVLPLFIRVDAGRVRLTATADRAGALRAGTELLALQGAPIGAWLERLGAYVSAEQPSLAHAQMEQSFPALLWLELGDVQAVELTTRAADGASATTRVEAVTLEGLRALQAAHPTPELATDFSTREVRLLPGGVAYLRPGPFFNTGAKAEGPAPSYEDSEFRAFLDDAFRRVLAAGARDLLVDLRNNPGGDNSFSDPMVAWFATRPFRFASRFVLKASAPTKAWYAQQRASGMPIDGSLERLMAAEAAQPDGALYPFELPLVPPREGPRFTGRVHVLVNRHSYSNAASVAALIQDYGFGTVLGEETADVPTSHASAVYFTLPRTGMTVTYPKSYFVRPSGDERVRGVVPQRVLPPPPIGSAEDAVLEAALAAIAAGR
jgi:hypothetical protein